MCSYSFDAGHFGVYRQVAQSFVEHHVADVQTLDLAHLDRHAEFDLLGRSLLSAGNQ